MPDDYELALGQEIAVWQAMSAVARRQRDLIVGHRADDLEALRGELQNCLGAALSARRRTLECEAAEVEALSAPLRSLADQALREAHGAIHLNLELLRDVCSYLQMVRAVLVPPSATSAYGQTRGPRPASLSSHSRVA